eukprot:9512798-Alexandrium_andersonii.AAC.1
MSMISGTLTVKDRTMLYATAAQRLEVLTHVVALGHICGAVHNAECVVVQALVLVGALKGLAVQEGCPRQARTMHHDRAPEPRHVVGAHAD